MEEIHLLTSEKKSLSSRVHFKTVANTDNVCVIMKSKFVNTLTDLMNSALRFMKTWVSSRD